MGRTKVLEALNSWKRDQFSYGTIDCCQLAGHVAKNLTGIDYLASFRYSNEAEALKIIEAHGGLRQTVTSVLGEPIDNPAVGCPVLVEINGHEVLGIKLESSVVCLTKNGMAEFKSEFIKCGWAI